MAASIPYPSIVFVPLDILTAEELNQLQANTVYLANLFPLAAASIADGAITNTKLGSAAVKTGNIDWTTLGAQYASADHGSDINIGTTDTTMLSVTVTPGKWAIFAGGSLNANGAAIGDSSIALKNGTSYLAGSTRFFNNQNQIWWLEVSTSAVFTATSNTKIDFVAQKGAGTLSMSYRSLIALRVG